MERIDYCKNCGELTHVWHQNGLCNDCLIKCPRCGEEMLEGMEPDGCEDRECPMWEGNQ